MILRDGNSPSISALPWKDDPVAAKTKWTPLQKSGAGGRTHKLVEIDITRVEFKGAFGAVGCAGTLFLFGFGVLTLFFYIIFNEEFDWKMLFILAFGLVITLVSISLLSDYLTPIVFDKKMNCFWKGRVSRDRLTESKNLKDYAKLGDIYALQIIGKLCKSSRGGSFKSYELNLVLTDGKRMNVVNHGDLQQILKDAQILSRFLGKPLWDLVPV